MDKNIFTLSEKLRQLLYINNLRPMDLARALEIPAPTIHRIITGFSTRPHHTTIAPIAKFFKLSIEQLTNPDPLPSLKNESRQLLNYNLNIIPIINWEKIDNYTSGNLDDRTVMNEIACSNLSENAFAVINRDCTMEPTLKKNSTLIFDPQIEVGDRDFALIKLNKPSIYVCRMLIIDNAKKYIKSLNSECIESFNIKELTIKDKIIGKLVEIRNSL